MPRPRPYVWSVVLIATMALPVHAAAPGPASRAAPAASPGEQKLDFAVVRRLAEELAKRPSEAPTAALPKPIASLSYDQYRDIRFRPSSALWRREGTRFQLQFFHLGSYFTTPVEVNIVHAGRVSPVRYSPSMFDFGKNAVDVSALGDLGFAGFRVHYPLNTESYRDELVTFLGASYFRGLSRGALYGASARGLAIDTAAPTGEEFPAFRTFWVEQPAREARQLTIYALLDSRSATGAYRFIIRPGNTTAMDVTASVFAREEMRGIGIAPITSMFLFGENSRACRDDFRPEVHDSDGLAVWLASGEQLFRPLDNPTRISLSSFQAPSLRGFGLVQRDRAFASYEDLEARYDRRPDVFVEPVGDWGDGAVFLLELPSPEEIHDNITAFWRPTAPIAAGAAVDLAYRISWGLALPQFVGASRVVATRTGAGSAPGQRRFVVDFSSGRAAESATPVEPVVSTSRGSILNAVAQRNGVTGGFRVSFELASADEEPVELRCFVRRGADALTETWSYLWTPQPARSALLP